VDVLRYPIVGMKAGGSSKRVDRDSLNSAFGSVFDQFGRGVAKALFKGMGEMGKVFKSRFIINLAWTLFLFRKLIVRRFQPLLCQPTLGGHIVGPLEIPFEGRKTSPGQITELFQGHVEHMVLLHKVGKVDSVGLLKIGQDIVYIPVDRAENGDGLRNLQGGNVLWKGLL